MPALPFGQKAPQDRHLSLPLAGLSARLRRGRKRVRGLHVHLESAPRRTGPTRFPGEGPSLFWNPWTPSSPRSLSQPSSPQSDFAWPPCSTQPPVAGVARGLVLLSLSPGGSLPLTGCSCFRCIPRRWPTPALQSSSWPDSCLLLDGAPRLWFRRCLSHARSWVVPQGAWRCVMLGLFTPLISFRLHTSPRSQAWQLPERAVRGRSLQRSWQVGVGVLAVAAATCLPCPVMPSCSAPVEDGRWWGRARPVGLILEAAAPTSARGRVRRPDWLFQRSPVCTPCAPVRGACPGPAPSPDRAGRQRPRPLGEVPGSLRGPDGLLTWPLGGCCVQHQPLGFFFFNTSYVFF